jgi:hypothetical protein
MLRATPSAARVRSVRAHLRTIVKRNLRRYGYPPDKQEKATQTVLEQAEVLSGVGAGVALWLAPATSAPLDAFGIPEQC